jgi:glucosamine kinase
MGLAGAANIMSDPQNALLNITACARAAFEAAGLSPSNIEKAAAVLGVAGANVGAYGNRIESQLPFASVRVVTDSLIALTGALGQKDGVVGAVGTGSVYGSRRGGTVKEIGGWGFIVGDQASGARVGRDLLEASLLAHDKIRPASPLTVTTMAEFSDDPQRVVEFAHGAKPKDFGRFAPRVFEYAEGGDPVALAIVAAGARAIGDSLDALLWPACRTVCLLGGLGGLYRRWLGERYQGLITEPKGDALRGAVALALELANGNARAGS